MGITLEQYRCSIGTFRAYKLKRRISLNYENAQYPYKPNNHISYNNTLYIVYRFAILYIFLFVETLVLDLTLSSNASIARY